MNRATEEKPLLINGANVNKLKVNLVVLWSLFAVPLHQGVFVAPLSRKLPLITPDPVCEDTKQPPWMMHLLAFFSSKPVWGACTVIWSSNCKTCPPPTPSSSVHSPRPANGAAANQITRCIAWCPTAPSRSAWTLCTSRSSAAPSVKTVNTHHLQKHTHTHPPSR